MHGKYNLDSDSDEDEEVVDNGSGSNGIAKSWHLQDIEKLKEQTSELLDSKWKDTRNRHLISKMLELEQPTITVKMVDFLLQDGVCESLMDFITQVQSPFPRPAPSDPHSLELKKAYRAVLLLSPENPSDALNAFLNKKANIIARKIFEIFHKDAAGSFYHAYRILECLLRCYPAEVFEGLCADNCLPQRISDMLRYTGYAPVCEMLVMLVALTPVPRSSQLFSVCSKARWTFLEELGNSFNVMQHICRIIANPLEYCAVDSYVNADQHASAATQLFLELVEKMSLEEPGEVLLIPIGQFPTIIDLLIETTISAELAVMTASGGSLQLADGIRRCTARILCFLLRRAADSEILCYTVQPNGAPPTTTCVPNRLFSLRENIVNHTRYRLADVMMFLLNFDSSAASGGFTHSTKDSIKYSAYEVSKPFTSLRALVIEIVVLMVESEETVASTLSADFWKTLILWAIKYAHNNIYHALFYRVVFAVLRQGQETSQRILFQKAKFASFLVENFIPFDAADAASATTATAASASSSSADPTAAATTAAATAAAELRSRRLAARGVIMNCANAIRLQVSTQAPSSFLHNFLNAHPKWNDFAPQLAAATEIQLQYAMGVQVTATDVRQTHAGPGALSSLLAEANAAINESSPEQASRFARSLGFIEEAEWSLHEHIPGERNSFNDPDSSHLVRRHSFEEGYGVFAHDYMEDSGNEFLVDEIDMAIRASNSNGNSPSSSFKVDRGPYSLSPDAGTVGKQKDSEAMETDTTTAVDEGERGSRKSTKHDEVAAADAYSFIESLPPPPLPAVEGSAEVANSNTPVAAAVAEEPPAPGPI